MNDYTDQLHVIAEDAYTTLANTFSVRENVMRLSRTIIQNSAKAIRCIHRRELNTALELLQTAKDNLFEASSVLTDHPEVYYSGFLEDAQKEYVEANATFAFVSGGSLPDPNDLQVTKPAYLNGLAESIGELRRYILDSLRRNDLSQCEPLLSTMDEIYSILVTMDFPDSVTRGLRRNTDAMRAVLERTRADLTTALRQQSLEHRLSDLGKKGIT